MNSTEMARIHAAAMAHERPWAQSEFDALLANRHTYASSMSDGFALWRVVAREAELLTIAVAPEVQGQGLGASLMSAWMSQAATIADEAFLEVASDNTVARALYAKCGFETVAVRADYYDRGQNKVDAFVLRTTLSGA